MGKQMKLVALLNETSSIQFLKEPNASKDLALDTITCHFTVLSMTMILKIID